jgi:hypothetical protein
MLRRLDIVSKEEAFKRRFFPNVKVMPIGKTGQNGMI